MMKAMKLSYFANKFFYLALTLNNTFHIEAY